MKRLTTGILSGVALATGGIVLGLSNPASAAVIWDWSYSAPGSISGSGTFTTTDVRPDGSFLIESITGTSEENPITSLIAPGGFLDNDNLLFGTFPQLTEGGFSFQRKDLAQGSNIRYSVEFNTYAYQPLGSTVIPINFEAIARVNPPTAVPEPSSLLGYITLGSLILASTLRKARFR